MIRTAGVYNNGMLAGKLVKVSIDKYTFTYDSDYLNDLGSSAISLSMPKTAEAYESKHLFPFFYGLLSEGVNKQTQCRLLKIDENDHFGLLLATASTDTIGAITIKEIKS